VAVATGSGEGITIRVEVTARPLFYCPTCNTPFEVYVPRCPVCRLSLRKTAGNAKSRAARRKPGSADRIRRRLSKTQRAAVFGRDGRRCLACGSVRNPTIDHVIPISQGGTNDPSNLQTLCAGCNNTVKRGKRTDYRAREEFAA
jgi:5-methylcytosine-specific restriction endonuclease McrA